MGVTLGKKVTRRLTINVVKLRLLARNPKVRECPKTRNKTEMPREFL